MLVIGAFLAMMGLSVISDKNSIVAGLFAWAIAAGFLYLGWRGRTRLHISQMGGHKEYRIRGKDPKLIDFMDAVNAKLG